MSKVWVAVAAVVVIGVALYAGFLFLPERKTPAQLEAEAELRQRCQQAQELTRQGLTRYRAGTADALIDAARSVAALGRDEQRCPGAAIQVFDSARAEIAGLMEQAEWLVLNSEIEPERVTALITAWGTPEDREDWQRRSAVLASGMATARPATLDLIATEDGKPACREESLRLPEAQRIRFRRAILKRLSPQPPQPPIVMGRLADERIDDGESPLRIEADFQFELFADTRPGTGMKIWLPGRLELSIDDGDLPPLRFSAEREVPENITSKIWYCDWAQAEALLQALLAELPEGLIRH